MKKCNKDYTRRRIILIVTIIFFFFYVFSPRTTEDFILRTTTPFLYVANLFKIGVSDIANAILNDKLELISINEELKNRYDRLVLSSGTNNEEPEDVVSANVILRPPQTKYDKLSVRYNAPDKLEKDSLVYDSNTGALIGYVSTVSNLTASVQLISSSLSSHQVKVNNFIGTTIGTGGGGFFVEVPSDLEVVVGDMVVYQEGDSSISIGEIHNIEGGSNEALKKVYASLFVNPFLITKVDISKSKKIFRIEEDE